MFPETVISPGIFLCCRQGQTVLFQLLFQLLLLFYGSAAFLPYPVPGIHEGLDLMQRISGGFHGVCPALHFFFHIQEPLQVPAALFQFIKLAVQALGSPEAGIQLALEVREGIPVFV